MSHDGEQDSSLGRREFLKLSAATVGASAMAAGGIDEAPAAAGEPRESEPERSATARPGARRQYNAEYSGQHLNRIAFPLGGIGAGMICLEGTGALSHVSLRNHPQIFHEPCVFAAIAIRGERKVARVLEGPVPGWKLFGSPGSGNGANGTSFGLPRFRQAAFAVRFPFAIVKLTDSHVPLEVEILGWSPFEPNEADDSSLPVAALEYCFTNRSAAAVAAVFSFNANNFLAAGGGNRRGPQSLQSVKSATGGFTLWAEGGSNESMEEGALSATVDDPAVKVNCAWFRGAWFDALTMAWKDVAEGACFDRPPVTDGRPSPGGTLFVPLELAPGASKTLVLRLAWYVGRTNLRQPPGRPATPTSPLPPEAFYRPWYAGRFANIDEVTSYWREHYHALRQKARRFSDCFYDSTLPPEVIEAVAANLTILKSPTVLRQTDGWLWSWEGCGDNAGCCEGSCTHVWNYAQAIPHLFAALERTLRETEFGPSQDDRGHQQFAPVCRSGRWPIASTPPPTVNWAAS